jgi:Vitamin K epoxide reductase family/Thioredoxin
MLSLLAAGISSLLLQKHMTGKAGISLFEAGCEVGGETGNVSCAKVLQSPYAVWPHVRGNEDAAAIRKKVPVAFLGLIYYLALAVWFNGVGLPDASRRWVLLLPGLLIAAGVASSVYFLFVMFAGQIRIIFKHFPLDGACNGEAAGLAESARVQRGNEGFWKAHDALFARQAPNELLAKLDVAEVIAALGLDPKQTHAEMKSPAITERINEDVTLARNSGVTATPWLILNDKVVDGIAANDLNFWDRIADRYWAQAGVARPASTVRRKPTPGSRSPTASR